LIERRFKMAKIQQDILLGRINEEIKGGAMTVSDLSKELQRDINNNVINITVNKGLRSIHSFLLQFLTPSAKKHFKWPE